ncbi:MAG: hypothetical protein ACRETD_14965, partial [Steroidobacteraceae bacterium]
MKKLLCIIGAIGIGGCSGNGGPSGSTTSGGGGVLGRALMVSAADSVHGGSARQPGVDVVADSLAFSRAQIGTLGLSKAHDDFQMIKMDHGIDGLNHVRLQQTRDGVRIWGSDVVVHSSDSSFTGIAGNVLAGLQGLDLKASSSAESAMTKAKSDYSRAAKTGDPLSFARETQELVILPIEGGNARLTWHVTFYTDVQAGIKPGLWNYFIDAHDGSIVDRFNGIHTAALEASGAGGNPRLSRTWSN